MSAVVPTSPPRSVRGYSLKVWLARNKGSIKLIASGVFAYASTLIPGIHPPELQGLVALVVGTGSKLALDGLDFWLSEVPLS